MSAVQLLVGWADLVATTVLVGGLMSAAFLEAPQRRGRYAVNFAALLLGLALLLEISLNAQRMSQISGIAGEALLADVFDMRWSHWWAVRAVALVAIGAGLTRRSPPWISCAGIGAASLLARSFQGHAGAHGTIAALADWIHLTAASAWAGGLVQLVLLPSVTPNLATRASKLFTIALGPLLLAGIYGAFLHVPTTARLVGTPYGRVLLAKIVLAAAGVAFGAINHFRHVPALEQGKPDAGRRLLRAARMEAILAIVLLLLSAALGVLPMPHAM
jgi:putative copper export protein